MNQKIAIAELIAIISASFSIIIASITIWKINSSVLRRLVMIQNKLTSLKFLVTVEGARTNDLEKFLASSLNYNIREFPASLEKSINDNYESEDTGF